MRSDRIRKQEYYQQNPELRDSFRNNTKRQSLRNNYNRQNDFNQLHNSRQSNTASRYDNQTYLPPIRSQSKQNYENQSFGKNSRAEQDKTQIYLQNCQYIAKNLRELRQRREKDRYKTMQTEPSSPQVQRQKKLFSRQDIQSQPKNPYVSSQGIVFDKSTRKKAINNYSNSKYQIEPYQKSQRQENQKQVKQPKFFRKLSSSRASDRYSPNKNNTNQKDQYNANIHKQLLNCLHELTHFLKDQRNGHQQPQKKDEEQPKIANKSRKHYIPSQSQSENSPRNRQMQQRHKNQRAQSLKYKAIVALKKLNERSRQFMNLASGRNKQRKSKQNGETTKTRPTVKFVEDVQVVPPTQRQNPSKKTSSKQIKPILSIPVNLKASRTSNRPNSRVSTSNKKNDNQNQIKNSPAKQIKNNQTLNSQLAKQLASYLQKQQNQNLQLSSCLKQMTQYLKIHNQEMVEMRVSRLQQKSPKKKQLTQKEKEDKLQKAVLNKLKKARLRGNIFKEKVEKFKNEHNLMLTKKQQQPKQGQQVERHPQSKDTQKQVVQQQTI